MSLNAVIGWGYPVLGDICDVRDGTHESPKYIERGYPLITSKNLTKNGLSFEKISFISKADYDAIEKRSAVADGDILYGMIGTVGNPVIVKKERDFSVKNVAIFKFKEESLISNKYLFYVLNSDFVTRQIGKESKGGTQKFVSLKVLRGLKIPLPPLDIQKKIAAVLEKADQLRKDCKQMEQELNSLAQSVFIDMFGDPVTNPKGWGSSSLEAEMQFLTSGSRGWAKHYDDEGDSIFIRIQNVLKDKLRLNDIQKISPPNTQEAIRTKVQDGDILLSITADLGRACVVRNIESDSYISQHLALIRIKESNLVPEFLSAFLISPAGIGQFEQKNKGGTKAGLNFSDIRSIKVLLPPKELQVKFKKIKEDLEQEIIQLNQTAKVYDDLFNSLMQKALKGELSL